MSLDHLRAALEAAGHTQAVLSHPETLASIGWGGIRLEHTFVGGPTDDEVLTTFEHTL